MSTDPERPAASGPLHPVEWTAPKIARFWEHYGSLHGDDQSYFGATHANAIARFAESSAKLSGHVADFGCGAGHLAQELLRRQCDVTAFDLSEKNVAATAERLAGRPGFHGVFARPLTDLDVPDDSFDGGFMTEVLEHLPPEGVPAVLQELRRVVRSGGFLCISVPNAENLQSGMIACPDCGATFHKVQHMQSFSADSLSELLRTQGFVPRHVAATDLTTWARNSGLVESLVRQAKRLLAPHRGTKAPHLIAVSTVS